MFFSLLSYEITTQYKYNGKFLRSSWTNILTPVVFLMIIPSLIVLYRFVHTLIHIRNYPKHLVSTQWGRFLYFIGLNSSLVLHYMIVMDGIRIHFALALLPLCISWFISFPLLCSRIHGLTLFVKHWHERLASEHQSRLLVWKANMLKAQVIAELIAYSLMTFLFLSISILCFSKSYRTASFPFQI